MSVSDSHPCPDERCAMGLTDSDGPFVCLHYDDTAEAINDRGRVARGALTIEHVIDEYRDTLDFETATGFTEHFDAESCERTGPTMDIEVRVNHTPVQTVTTYPHDTDLFPGFDAACCYTQGFADGYFDALSDSQHCNATVGDGESQ